MPKFVVISELDFPQLLIVEATDEAKALEIAVKKTIAWCQEMDSDWVMELDSKTTFGDDFGCNGTPVRAVSLTRADGEMGSIELWMPSEPDIEKCSQY